MREKPNYRDELEEILKTFNNRHVLTISEVSQYTGRSYRWCKKYLNIPKSGITATALAKALSNL